MLVCCGLTTFDLIQRVDRLPGSNEKIDALDAVKGFGGPAANAAGTAALLGVPVTLVTAIGDGPLGRVVRAELEGVGVRVVDVLAGQDVDPPVSTVLVTAATGERAVVGLNDRAEREFAPLHADVLEGARVLHLDGRLDEVAVPLALAARALRGEGVVPQVSLDGGSWKPGAAQILAETDVAVVSADFHAHGTPSRHDAGSRADLAALAALGPAVVARSAGEGAVRVLDRGREATVDVLRAERVVDTLGAGDVLHGAFAAAWWVMAGAGRFDVEAALAFGTRVATASVEHSGARGWAADPPVLEALRAELADLVG